MITLHGSCRMCGGLTAAVEVEVPHATPEHRKACGVSPRGILATAICQVCTRAAVAAWAEHGTSLPAAWKPTLAIAAEDKAK